MPRPDDPTLDQRPTRPAASPHDDLPTRPAVDSLRASIPSAPLEAGSHFGPYIIERLLGEGGMGQVYLARDPRLHRRVALKLLVPAVISRLDPADARARLLREAQALAQVSHPNVVAVYEAGELEGRVYLAMEYAEGVDLRAWLQQTRRPWREILSAYVSAGRGLAAAHQAGLLHRDFKPHNVLMPHDGRPRVVDFGLARSEGGPPDGTPPEPTREQPGPANLQQLTRAGFTMGTPGYMAPEQLRGERIDARCDQFAFCVSLFEGLFGKRPWEETDLAILELQFSNGKKPAAPTDTDVPVELSAAVLRGLSVDPKDRWPSMEPLLDQLVELERRAPAPRPRWFRQLRRAATVTLGALTAFLAVFFAVERAGLARLDQQCQTDAQACIKAGELHFTVARYWSGDWRSAERSFAQACELGNSLGCGWVSRLYFNGWLPMDPVAEADWANKGCALGNQTMCAEVADYLFKGYGRPRDASRAFELFNQLCDQGVLFACERVATMLQEGTDVPQNLPRAREIFQAVCDQGFGESCVELGLAALNGLGVEQSDREAARYARLGCERGASTSFRERCWFLGQLLLEGRGIEKDFSKGVQYLEDNCLRTDGPRQWHHKAAPTCVFLGNWFLDSTHEGYDLERAARYLERACTLGTASACIELAQRLAKGEPGLPQNLSWSRSLQGKACALGATEACPKQAGSEDGN